MSWPRRRVVVATALGVAVIVVLVVVGRSERSSQATREMNGFHIVQKLIGPLDSKTLSGYRVFAAFDCLTYRRGKNPFALELCVDHSGRVVEAIDRRSEVRRIWSVRFDPTESTDHVDRAEVNNLLHKMGAQ